MRYYLLITAVAALSTWVVCFPVTKIARKITSTKLRLRDVHTIPTPRLGGIAMLVGTIIAFAVSLQLSFFEGLYRDDFQIQAILISCIALCTVGIIDDIFDIDWMIKLAVQIIAAAYVAQNGVQIMSLPIAGLVIGSNRVSMVLTVIIIVAVINAINFIDGLDGLAAGVTCIGATAFFWYAWTLISNQYNFAGEACLLSAILIGICIGFLPHNFNPAKIFMGDTGSQLIGFLLVSASLVITGKIDEHLATTHSVPAFMPILLPFLVCLLPLADMILAIFRRLFQGKSPFSPDKKHLHHRMLEIGHTHRGAVMILWAWATLFAFGGFLFIGLRGRVAATILVISAIIIFLLTIGPKFFIKPIFGDVFGDAPKPEDTSDNASEENEINRAEHND